MDAPTKSKAPMDDLTPLQEVMLEFRAGKMDHVGTLVVPDRRKGLVRIGRGEEGLVHFQWLDRGCDQLEEDQIILPDDATFEKVGQTSERVYLLKFNSDGRKYFFWMQEPKADRDTEICCSVNYYMNQPLVFPDDEELEASVPLQTSERSEDTARDEVSSRAGNMVDQNRASELSSEVTSAGPVQLADLQRILRNIQPVGANGEQDEGLTLGDILKPDLVSPLVGTLPLEQRLASYLPEGSWHPEDVIELLQSPPFRQQVEMFNHVLRTGQIDLSQFGIDPSKYNFTVLSFLEALDDSVAKESVSGETSSGQDKRTDGDAMDES